MYIIMDIHISMMMIIVVGKRADIDWNEGLIGSAI